MDNKEEKQRNVITLENLTKMDISIYPHDSNLSTLNLRLHKSGLAKLKKEFKGGNCTLFEKDGRAYLREVDIDDKYPRKFTSGNFCFKEAIAPSLHIGTYILEEVEPSLFELLKI